MRGGGNLCPLAYLHAGDLEVGDDVGEALLSGGADFEVIVGLEGGRMLPPSHNPQGHQGSHDIVPF